jgi:branched-chain amino acid transport system permease protein
VQQFVNVTLSGLAQGAIYAAFALALVLIWRSTRIVNFAQGAMAMFTTYLALTLIDAGWSYWVGLVVALGAILFGSDFRSFPAPFDLRGFTVGGFNIAFTPNSIFVIVSVVVVMAVLVALFRFTDLGLRMRAAAYSQEVSRLLGVKVGAMLTLGWALAAVVGSLSGLLIAGGGLVFPAYMDAVIVYGFVAAVLGGLDSPGGAVVGGLAIGLALSYVSGFIPDGSALVPVAALVILVVVLLVRPQGLFARAAARRV